MVLIPMFFLVSFGFESLPLPVGRASFSVALSPSLLVFWKPSSWIFFPYAGESTSPPPFYIYYYIEFPRVSIKQNEKPGWKHKQKEREKVEKKGGKKSSASSY